MPKLEDGSEFGLKGHFKEDFSVRTRVGLAPRAGHVDRDAPYKRIATEEAWTFPALVKAQVEYFESGDAPGDDSLKMAGMFSRMPSLQEMLQNLGGLRIQHMDEFGIARQLLLLTAPGVQVVRPGDGTPLAREANDIAAEACRNHPDRFSALAAFDPRDVAGSVKEIDRAMGTLGLNGAVLNSHWQGHYIDEQDYWPILEAIEANDGALYIHPTAPFNAPHYETRGFFGALGGFPHDVWLHTMGIIFSGAFDRFPKLRLVIGHLGECLPLHIYRFDWMQGNADNRAGLRGGQPPVKLRHPVSYYFQNNIWVTTSGVGWEPAIRFCQEVMGPDRVLYAMDYPYQQSFDEVAAYDRMAMSPEHKKMLMEDNARSVFRIRG
ncbi:amidohydrolase family protein [Altererythrobacter salegens]|uniref:Amidohydrolase family protein n=1 Tax=Croceibacterium salegens TaxID=1737568 RepID=A0A6I4SYT5_9SPHN|nr:amidohydrolase family protein [Croceibacterium salegens]MXO61225.1 amidohydrolase family protein [Croceibacterium salegens]